MNRRQIVLAPRLRAIAELVPSGGRICDVGCDHAHIPLHLLQRGRIPGALAMDVIPGPLEKARDNLELYASGRERELIELRLSDGLDIYEPGEAQTLVIAGMGGWLMRRILLRQPAKTRSFTALVLQPQSDPEQVRDAVRELGFCIDEERMVIQDGKFYQAFRAVEDRDPDVASRPLWPDTVPAELSRDCEDRFGPVLLKRRDPVLHSYLTYRKKGVDRILETLRNRSRSENSSKEQELTEEGRRIAAALSLYSAGR